MTFTTGGLTINFTDKITVSLPQLDVIGSNLNAQYAEIRSLLMALDTKTEALRKQLDEATTALGTEIQTFIDNARISGQATSDEINAALQPIADRLTKLANPGTGGP